MPRPRNPASPFRHFSSSPEVIRLVVMMYVCFPLSLRNVEDLLFERGIDICHETVRFWWNRFGPMFAADIRRQRVSRMKGFRVWRWHLDEVFVKINGERQYPGLFTQDECALILSAADRRFMPSTIHDASGREVPHPLRSSSGAPLHWFIEDPALHALNRRLAAATGTAYDQAEPLLVLKYEPGQPYRPHFDALPGLENQRIATALVYLNSGYSGGQTAFPRIGVEVAGQPGDVLVFRNTLADGAADPLSEHAGLPVTSGVRYLATRWIRTHSNIPSV